MGSITFHRHDGVNGNITSKRSFDSSPQFSLPKMFGFSPETYRQEALSESDASRVYAIYAAMTPQGEPARVGTLYAKTRDQIRRDLGER